MGLGSSHGRVDAGPAATVPKGKGLRHRPHKADDRPRHISSDAIDGRGCVIGCAGLSPSAVAKWAGQIRLLSSPFSHAMLRIHGDRSSLLAAPTAHRADQQLQIPQALRPVVAPLSESR